MGDNTGTLFVILIATMLTTVGVVGLFFATKVSFRPYEPQTSQMISFKTLCQNKSIYRDPRNLYGHWFGNGTIIYTNETEGRNFVAITPVPITKEELTEKDFIIAQIPEPLELGDVVNMRGRVIKAEDEENVIYYLSYVRRIDKTGKIPAEDPDFQRLIDFILDAQKAEIGKNNLSWYFNPASPLSPFNPSGPLGLFNPNNPASPNWDD